MEFPLYVLALIIFLCLMWDAYKTLLRSTKAVVHERRRCMCGCIANKHEFSNGVYKKCTVTKKITTGGACACQNYVPQDPSLDEKGLDLSCEPDTPERDLRMINRHVA